MSPPQTNGNGARAPVGMVGGASPPQHQPAPAYLPPPSGYVPPYHGTPVRVVDDGATLILLHSTAPAASQLPLYPSFPQPSRFRTSPSDASTLTRTLRSPTRDAELPSCAYPAAIHVTRRLFAITTSATASPSANPVPLLSYARQLCIIAIPTGIVCRIISQLGAHRVSGGRDGAGVCRGGSLVGQWRRRVAARLRSAPAPMNAGCRCGDS